MKKFQTVTEKELLEMACDELLRRFLKEKEIADSLPGNPISAARCERARERYEEVRGEILRLERKAALTSL